MIKKVDTYIMKNILSVFFGTIAISVFMLLAFDLFSHLETYTNNKIPAADILKMTLLYIPEALVMATSAALLFSATYFFSNLQANNELITLYNAGYSFKRLIIPALFSALIIVVLMTFSNETILRYTIKERQVLNEQLFGNTWSKDNDNITLQSEDKQTIIFARRYYNEDKSLNSVTIIFLDEDRNISDSFIAPSAEYKDNTWIFKDVKHYEFLRNTTTVKVEELKSFSSDRLEFTPSLFKNLSDDIKTMSANDAFNFLKKIEALDSKQYSLYATELWERLLQSLTALIMMIIAALFPYKFKKNILLFSIIFSLAIAVVYYVIQMLTLIMAKQGAIPPIFGVISPMIIIVVIMLIINKAVNRS